MAEVPCSDDPEALQLQPGNKPYTLNFDQKLTFVDCSELAREKMWGRLYLAPLLQAEEDRDQVRRYYADKAREKELLGAEHKVYNSDRYVSLPEIHF
jgi:hypothetical protein